MGSNNSTREIKKSFTLEGAPVKILANEEGGGSFQRTFWGVFLPLS